MNYTFACFISYKRPPALRNPQNFVPRPTIKHLWLQFAEVFEQILGSFLNVGIPIFRDTSLQPGANYPNEFARNLCKSVCMVALVVPEYFESKWCCAEWEAMRALEEERLGPGKLGLIIPVNCVGDAESLKAFFGNRNVVELADIVSPVRQLKYVPNLEKIRSIANTINEFSKHLKTPPSDCDCATYSLAPLEIGPDEIVPRIREPSPFG